MLEGLQIKNVYDADFLFSNLDLKDGGSSWSADRCKVEIDLYLYAINSFREQNDLKVNSLDLVLTEKCSLKCKDCSNLMQYYAKPVDEDFSRLISALEKFMSVVDYVYEIRFIGGEPLMYKRIDEVIEKALSYKNCGNIVIYTNGTIVPKENKINIFKNDKIYFKISNYGSISRNVEKLEKTLEKNNIHYLTAKVTRWQDCARIEKFERPLEITKKIFGDCCVSETLTLLHGKLFLCPFSAHAENLHAIPKHPSDSIDISNFQDKKVLKDKIRNFYFRTEYLEACKSCNGRDHNVASVDAAIQTKNPLEYTKVI
jgi:organic radical activating enzyme